MSNGPTDNKVTIVEPASHDEEPITRAASIRILRRIEWIDTDAAGIYHWTTVFRLAESAEAALHTSLGIEDRTFGGTPRVAVTCEFRRSLRFNDLVEVRLEVLDVGRASIRYGFDVQGPDGLAAQGTLTACLVDRQERRAVAWPADLRRLLSEAGEQRAAE
jgi:acyl-CoA thioesterase FadM